MLRIEFAKDENGNHTWPVINTETGQTLAILLVQPTLHNIGPYTDNGLAIAAADYRNRVNARCATKGKRARY